jgi:hypothetical protein
VGNRNVRSFPVMAVTIDRPNARNHSGPSPAEHPASDGARVGQVRTIPPSASATVTVEPSG